MRISLLFLLVTITQFGCVLKTKYDDTLARQIKCEDDLKKTSSDRDQWISRQDEAKKKLSDTELRNEELSQTNQLLANKNTDITKKTTEAQQELINCRQEKAKKQELFDGTKRTYDEWYKSFQKELENESLTITQNQNEIWFTILEPQLFGTQEELFPPGKKLLDKVANTLKKAKGGEISIAGHAPANKPKKGGKSKSAWEVSSEMAAKVTSYMQSIGVSESKIKVVGFGDARPLPKGPASERNAARVDLKVEF